MSIEINRNSGCSEPNNGLSCNGQDAQGIGVGFNARLLVAEDNPVNQEVAKMMLEVMGCSVDLAENGIQAVELAMATSYDLILMDCQMPQLDGFEASRMIREREAAANVGKSSQRPMTIIAITGNSTDQDRDLCLSMGMDDFLRKPYTIEELRAILARWLPAGATAETAAPLPRKKEATVISESSPIDLKLLDNIRSVQREGAPDILAKVIDHYLSQSPDTIGQLNEAVAADDGELIRAIVHRFKSGSANLGALRLAEICEAMESSARVNTMAVNKEILAELECEYEAVRIALAAVRRGGTQ
jgi:CheY-like chemotaxis protein/HPt (histidine-containing phosphotransfer) domain-containing protein